MKMDAKNKCEWVLKELKSSNLNFVLQETPFSAYLTIRKSFVKNLNSATSIIGQTFNESAETLHRKIEALEAENSCLKSDLLKYKTDLKKSDHVIFKLEENIENTKLETQKQAEVTKKVEKQKRTLEIILDEKEKEIFKLTTVAKNLNFDNSKIRDNLNNISRSLKLSEKEASKAKIRCENFESTVENLKAVKSSLLKNIKKLEKSKKNEQFENQKSKVRDARDLLEATTSNALYLDRVDEEKELAEDILAYNIPVSSNPFRVLDNEKDYLAQNNNNFCETFEH